MLGAALALWLASPAPQLALEPCAVPGLEGPARCGRLPVWENRGSRSGRRIPLNVVVVPSTGLERQPDAVFVISGGPGQAATRDVAKVAQELKAERPRRDLVFVDQRGTGGSNALPCSPFGEDDWRLYFGSPESAQIRACRDRLTKRADLARYTTDEAVEDLEEVRQALATDRINLDAGSYGTRVALLYMRRYPGRVRTAVLKGLNAPSLRIPLPFARAGQEALERLFADCAADAGCARAFPRLREEFSAVLERLEKTPASVTMANPATGRPMSAQITRATFAARVHLLLFASALASRIPLLVHQAYEGDWAGFAELAAAFGKAIVDQIDFGMQLSVLCAEDLPFIGPADLERETRGTFLGADRVRSAMRFCREWPRGDAAEDLRRPVHSDVPTLLVSGAFDPATPPRFAEEVASGLTRARQVVFPGSHLDGGDCASAMAAALVEAGSLDGLDTSCTAQIRRPPFALPASAAVEPRPRARDLGLAPGLYQPGPLNAITDVAGVRVGHVTLLEGDQVRTGVTTVVPHGGNVFQDKVAAGIFVGNAFGKLAGSTQVEELGTLETPIVLTNTLSVAEGIAGAVEETLAQAGNEQVRSVNAVVGETNDGGLNDIRGRHVTVAQVREAIRGARAGSVPEGSVGAGTGTRCFGWKGGIGTSSRVLPAAEGGYTLGVLVQTNYGGTLTMDGVPVGRELERQEPAAGGSCMVVVATDAPLDARDLKRLAARAVFGLGRTGSSYQHGSGDYAIAFSTSPEARARHSERTPRARTLLPSEAISPLFQAALEATEEAVYNSLLQATTVSSALGTAEAIPIDRLRALLRRHGRGR